MSSVLTTEQKDRFKEHVQLLMAYATRCTKKTHHTAEGWAVHWVNDELEVEVFFSNDVGYRFTYMGMGCCVTLSYGKDLDKYDTPPVLVGGVEECLNWMQICGEIWHKGEVQQCDI